MAVYKILQQKSSYSNGSYLGVQYIPLTDIQSTSKKGALIKFIKLMKKKQYEEKDISGESFSVFMRMDNYIVVPAKDLKPMFLSKKELENLHKSIPLRKIKKRIGRRPIATAKRKA